ncbi:hypothetical protein [Phytohabitans rumicis]|uniref:hypothetical protein n=1 Tax=Phytohabitans rumicis TaxID=1076125 RepID=UPI001C49C346|nr:hypothetical protein [Phytohabitans rumicis]
MYVHPEIYFQTCAWADNDEVWFTVHVGNTGSYAPVTIWPGYVRNGVWTSCPTVNFSLDAGVKSTAKSNCDFSRTTAAYQAYATVQHDSTAEFSMSDSLQVQG